MNIIQEMKITSLGQLLDQVTPTAHDQASGRLRDCSIYRGLSNAQYDLFTSLDRLGGTIPAHTKVHLENHILRNFVRYSRPFIPNRPSSEWEYLVIAQHHGLPTRLLDWTYSPLVAAHFATYKGNEGNDRIIWKLDWIKVHQYFHLPPVAILNFDEVLIDRGYQSVWEFCESQEAEHNQFVCMIEPPSLDSRIVAQSATFTISSSKTRSLNQMLIDCGLTSAIKRFIIPADRIDYIRDQLDLCSVDERRLFPDLGGLADEMTRYYSTSPKGQSF
jgi:hypothetical protein